MKLEIKENFPIRKREDVGNIKENLLCLDEIRLDASIKASLKSISGSKADDFIQQWKNRFSAKCKQNPHLSLPTMHNVIGVILRYVKIYYGAEYIDLRTSLLAIQDSGTGKKPAMEFAEIVVAVFSQPMLLNAEVC